MRSAVRSTKPARILVVEDHTGTARGLRALLVSRGYRVDLATDGSAALQQAAAREYRLVVADCDLGGQDGTELVRRIRSLYPALPVLVVTARDREVVLAMLVELGLEDCLEKPVHPEALLDAVERHLRP